MADDDLTQTEIRALQHIVRLQPYAVTAQTMGDRMGPDPDPQLLLATLAERGYIERTTHSTKHTYELTERGRTAIERETSSGQGA